MVTGVNPPPRPRYSVPLLVDFYGILLKHSNRTAVQFPVRHTDPSRAASKTKTIAEETVASRFTCPCRTNTHWVRHARPQLSGTDKKMLTEVKCRRAPTAVQPIEDRSTPKTRHEGRTSPSIGLTPFGQRLSLTDEVPYLG